MSNKQAAYAVTISGTYRNSKKEIVDFQNVKGIIPMCDVDIAHAMLRKRYATMWITESSEYKERVQNMRTVYVDSLEKTEHEFSFEGKDIKEMTYEELQDLATVKDLRGIPLYKAGGLRQGQMMAYAEYSNKILGKEVNIKEEGFNFATLPPLVVDSFAERNLQKSISNEDMIQIEQSNTTTGKAKFTRAELEKMANEKGVVFHPNIADEKLQQRIFNGS